MNYLVIDTSKSLYDDTWSIAKVAHDKLVTEAGFRDHDLRKLVGHAMLYDRLLEEVNSSPQSSPSSSPPPSPKKLALEPIAEEHQVQSEEKEDVGIVVEEEAGLDLQLMKVANHAENMSRAYEIAVEEIEVLEDD